MAKSSSPVGSAGGKWAMPAATTGAPVKESPKSGSRGNVAGANKHASAAPTDYSIASSLSAKNK